MSDSDNDRKRKAAEIDATAVAPKKKLAAQAALAAAEAAEKDSAGPAKAGGSGSVTVKLEPGAKPSYSVEETAPSGAYGADSEEVLKFQHDRLAAALEVGLHGVATGGTKYKHAFTLRAILMRQQTCASVPAQHPCDSHASVRTLMLALATCVVRRQRNTK